MEAVVLSMATAFCSFLVSETKLFEPLRWRLREIRWLGELVSCGFCLSVWFAVMWVLGSGMSFVSADRWIALPLEVAVVSWLASFQWALLCWLLDRIGK